jgi:small-conductance mechanosensitive channel
MTAADLDLLRQVTWHDVGSWFLGDGLRIVLTVVIAWVVRFLGHRAISRVVRAATSKGLASVVTSTRAGHVLQAATEQTRARHIARTRTMGALLRSIVTFLVGAIAMLTVLALIGIPLAPLLASAGVGGVALGFGAQSLVKDFLSGIFMILEDQYGVGDVIAAGEVVGTVEDVTLRVTQIRDANGVTWYVRNGEIVRIGNRSQGWSTAIVDVPIAYTESVERVIPIIREAARAMDTEPAWGDRMLEPPEVVGVESVTGYSVTIRTIAKCLPQEHIPVQRELRERIKSALDAAGVQAPPAVPPFGGLGGPRP